METLRLCVYMYNNNNNYYYYYYYYYYSLLLYSSLCIRHSLQNAAFTLFEVWQFFFFLLKSIRTRKQFLYSVFLHVHTVWPYRIFLVTLLLCHITLYFLNVRQIVPSNPSQVLKLFVRFCFLFIFYFAYHLWNACCNFLIMYSESEQCDRRQTVLYVRHHTQFIKCLLPDFKNTYITEYVLNCLRSGTCFYSTNRISVLPLYTNFMNLLLIIHAWVPVTMVWRLPSGCGRGGRPPDMEVSRECFE